MTDLVTTGELARRLGVTPPTIRKWTRLGLIPVLRISPKVMRFDPTDVTRVLRERGSAPQHGTSHD
jgi:excisionase family DNA binding protein